MDLCKQFGVLTSPAISTLLEFKIFINKNIYLCNNYITRGVAIFSREKGASSRTMAPTEPSLTKTFIAGGVGGAYLVVVGHPLDTIKVPPAFTGLRER